MIRYPSEYLCMCDTPQIQLHAASDYVGPRVAMGADAGLDDESDDMPTVCHSVTCYPCRLRPW